MCLCKRQARPPIQDLASFDSDQSSREKFFSYKPNKVGQSALPRGTLFQCTHTHNFLKILFYQKWQMSNFQKNVLKNHIQKVRYCNKEKKYEAI